MNMTLQLALQTSAWRSTEATADRVHSTSSIELAALRCLTSLPTPAYKKPAFHTCGCATHQASYTARTMQDPGIWVMLVLCAGRQVAIWHIQDAITP